MDDVLVDIGGANTVREFSENLRGAKAGEERSFVITYPEDAQDKRLAGKTLEYKVQIKAIKKKQIPELNDDFAKELGDFKSFEDLRKRIREQLESQKRHEIEHTAKDKLVQELVSRNNFPVPESLVDQQVTSRLERGFRALAAQGMRPEDMRKMDFGRLRQARSKGISDPGKDRRQRKHSGERCRSRSGSGTLRSTIAAAGGSGAQEVDR